MDITNQVKTAASNVSLSGGVFSLDLTMTNQSASTYVPYVKLNVIGISSASGTVRLTNADNGASGVSPANAALFDYTNQLGSDQLFSSAETTGARTLRFADSTSELFQFDVNVSAFLSANNGGANQPAQSGGGSQSGAPNNSALSALNLLTAKQAIRFTVNPLTKGVTAQLVLR